MKRIIVFLICGSLVLTSCRTWFPIRPDDHVINIEIRESYLERHTQEDRICGSGDSGGDWGPGNWSGGDCEAIIVVVVAVITIIIVCSIVEAVVVGRDIHVHPSGFGDEYIQQLYPGENKVFLPQQFGTEGGTLFFNVTGTHEGSWGLRYRPGVEYYLLD
ncbi:hypothetical protein ACFL4W_03685 [Planctomycetota bacterium]